MLVTCKGSSTATPLHCLLGRTYDESRLCLANGHERQFPTHCLLFMERNCGKSYLCLVEGHQIPFLTKYELGLNCGNGL
jgi:hypothetical protein